MVFVDYARFYDLYYAEKNYGEEADFIISLARKYGVNPATLLDMGCGTGKHLLEFSKRQLQCDGFDLSTDMLSQAKQRLAGTTTSIEKGNLISYANGKKYDIVVSMFAVMGYLIENSNLVAGFTTAKKHLQSNGVFIFDGWFGPAVLAQKPEVRSHTYNDGPRTVTRKAVPFLDAIKQCVTIKYDVSIVENGKTVDEITEEHTMRFMFVQETALALNAAGLQLLGCSPFLNANDTLTTDTWNVTFVAGLKKP